MLELFLWLKYVRRARIVLLAVAAVAVSAALIIVVASLFTGFIRNVERHSGATLGDVCITSTWGPPIPRYGELIAMLENLGCVKAAAPMNMGVGLVHLGGGNVQQVTIIGIDPVKEEQVTNLIPSLRRGPDAGGPAVFAPPAVEGAIPAWIGIRAVAEPNQTTDTYNMAEVDTCIGKQAILITGAIEQSKTQDATPRLRQKTLRLQIQAVVHSGHFLNDQNLYVPIADLQKLIYPDQVEPAASRIKIRLAPGADEAESIEKIQAVWSQFSSDVLQWSPIRRSAVAVVTSKQMYADYFAELHKQMGVLIIIFGVISSVGVLLVFCIFYMMVMTKRRDIGIIRSCGAGRFSVAGIFLGFAACVGLVGSACGVALGWVIITNINAIEGFISKALGWKIWRSSVYIFERMPSELDWGSIYWIVPAAIAACLLGVMIPALVAARMRPVDILRYE